MFGCSLTVFLDCKRGTNPMEPDPGPFDLSGIADLVVGPQVSPPTSPRPTQPLHHDRRSDDVGPTVSKSAESRPPEGASRLERPPVFSSATEPLSASDPASAPTVPPPRSSCKPPLSDDCAISKPLESSLGPLATQTVPAGRAASNSTKKSGQFRVPLGVFRDMFVCSKPKAACTDPESGSSHSTPERKEGQPSRSITSVLQGALPPLALAEMEPAFKMDGKLDPHFAMQWTVDQVVQFVTRYGPSYQPYGAIFKSNDIDGSTLVLAPILDHFRTDLCRVFVCLSRIGSRCRSEFL